jgi:hypothetical protein
MKSFTPWLCIVAVATAHSLSAGQTVVVNDYFSMKYRGEPVSFDIKAKGDVTLKDTPTQVERLDAETVRLWTTVDTDRATQMVFTVQEGKPAPGTACAVSDAGEMGGVNLAQVTNSAGFAVKMPVGNVTFASARSAFDVPGPVVSVSRDGQRWYGTGYLDSARRVKSVTCTTTHGAIFFESRIVYEFEDNRQYTARVRVFAGKPYAQIFEDFNVGGASQFVFNFDDWQPTRYLMPGDADIGRWMSMTNTDDTAEDFIKIEGQHCFARLVIWSQHNYIRGKQETLGLADANVAIGGFYIRPDRWTRAKVNHVDLYQRPEAPGAASEGSGASRMTRGTVGLEGSTNRIAMEAWLVDGHREWAIYAVEPSNTQFFCKAHIVEGVWPLDRINRLQLVWNADGSPVAQEDTAPMGKPVFDDAPVYSSDLFTGVFKSTGGRCGVMRFNGSNPSMRGGYARVVKPIAPWAATNLEHRTASYLRSIGKFNDYMVGPAMAVLLAMDDSAYPGPRAMLPWSDPEALNPFYQGMENMNFNVDRYESILAVGEALEAMGCPWASNAISYVAGQYRMQLGRYVYPQSGCWEESHTYAGCILRATLGAGARLKEPYLGNVFADPLVQKVFNFWTMVLSPRNADYSNKRHVLPIGDHGGPNIGSHAHIEKSVELFAGAGTPDSIRTAKELAWGLTERGWSPSNAPAISKPEWRSQWLQGYGSVLRATAKDDRESMIVVRAGQSWGHHHMDKGSLWGFFRNTHFFGDAAWGGPPGGTYWNPYKQGPAGHTTIEFVGILNWPLPCKYPAPWIADEDYEKDFDYCMARCLYPFNPKLEIKESSPVAFRNGFDRQVLLVHPDILVVRDNIETTVPTIWRMHSFQFAGTTVEPGGALLAATNGVHGRLRMVYPDNVRFTTTAVHDLPIEDGRGKIPNEPFGSPPGGKKPYDTRTLVLRWDMPRNTSATWVFSVHEKDAKPVKVERLDDAGRVTRLTTDEGMVIVAFMNTEPFAWKGEGMEFEGSVGLIADKKTYPIRATKLTAR